MNNSGFKSDPYVQLITTGATETHPSKLKAAYSQLNDLLLDQVFVFPISIAPPLPLAKANVHGVEWTAHESPWYSEAWIG